MDSSEKRAFEVSPEEALAAAYAAERNKTHPGSGDQPTRSERQFASWTVQQIRNAGWRLLRTPKPDPVSVPPRCPDCGDGSPEQGGHPLGGCNGKCLARRRSVQGG